jgi:hypothetical protein
VPARFSEPGSGFFRLRSGRIFVRLVGRSQVKPFRERRHGETQIWRQNISKFFFGKRNTSIFCFNSSRLVLDAQFNLFFLESKFCHFLFREMSGARYLNRGSRWNDGTDLTHATKTRRRKRSRFFLIGCCDKTFERFVGFTL